MVVESLVVVTRGGEESSADDSVWSAVNGVAAMRRTSSWMAAMIILAIAGGRTMRMTTMPSPSVELVKLRASWWR